MTSANATADGDEDRQEADHVAVFLGELRPVLAEEVRQRLGEQCGEEPREQDRADADQPPDRALREAEHEEAHEEEHDEQVGRPDPVQERAHIHVFVPPYPGPRRRRERRKGSSGHPAAARRTTARRAASVGGPVGSGAVGRCAGAPRSGPEARPDVGGHAGHHRGDDRVELRLGQGPLVVAQLEPVGQALVALGQRPAAIDVEQRHAAQERAAVAADGRLDVARPDAPPGR